ncbi:hypothetical protein CI109_105864 [Kwoniella shandongensis]|uniref:Golgi apyrase n=1 Tax=Kwoniella shandongensis TaxID=1734106 RepID=A0AAJ8LP49_9TREE
MAPSITPSSTHYALVIDAGSSGSRLQIYSWRDPDLERAEILKDVKVVQNGPVGLNEGRGGRWWWRGKGKGKEKEDVGLMERKALRRLVRVGKGVEGDNWVKRVEPGISTVDPNDIPTYLAPLLSHALQHIPPSQHSTTPIYVLATAGMRLLPDSTRDAILKSTCDLICTDYPFRVEGPSSAGPCGENIRVISGEEEGMWGWVAVNYLMDGFGHAPDPDSSSDSVTPVDVNHHSPTFGFLDMGGASTQLAFSPSAGELAKSNFPPDELRTVSLRLLSGEDVTWPVFVTSWLGFGTNRARERYIESLTTKWRQEYEITGTGLDKPIVDPCLPINLAIPSPDSSKHPGFIGSGSFSQCLTELTPLLEHTAPCPADHCLFAGQPTPHIDFEREDQRGFIGISEYWYTTQQVLGLGGVWDWGEWEKGMNEFCAREWKDIEDQVEKEKSWKGAEVDLGRLQLQCFKGAWISNVLHEGIGIPRLVDVGGNDTLTGGEVGDTNAEAERRAREKGLLEGTTTKKHHHFQSMDEIEETAISWTLGKMVIEASKAVQPRSAIVEDAWMSKLGPLRLGGMESRLNDFGIEAVWGYGVIAFVLLACVFSCRRRRFFASSPGVNGSGGRRSRKPSISSPTSTMTAKSTWRRLPWPLSVLTNTTADSYSLEDGYISDSSSTLGSKSRFASVGRLRLWSLRLGKMINRTLPFTMGGWNGRRPTGVNGLPRHNSMTMLGGSAFSPSQPPSPRNQPGSFFVPAYAASSSGGGGGTSAGGLSVPGTNGTNSRPGSATPLSMSEGISSSGSSTSIIGLTTASSPSPSATINSSPPRLKNSRPGKSRQNSNTFSTFKTKADTTSGNGGGWNDPPIGLFSGAGSTSTGGGAGNAYEGLGLGDPRTLAGGGGVLTPTASTFAQSQNGGIISRNSSRVNLSEIGLAQRSMSRAGTPGFEEAH